MSRPWAKLSETNLGDYLEVGVHWWTKGLPVGAILEVKGEDSWRRGGNWYVESPDGHHHYIHALPGDELNGFYPAARSEQPLIVWYENWRGEITKRCILPKSVRFGTSEWHKEPGWLLMAHDVDKGEDREFAFSGFRSPQVEVSEAQAIIAAAHKIAARMGAVFVVDPDKLANFPDQRSKTVWRITLEWNGKKFWYYEPSVGIVNEWTENPWEAKNFSSKDEVDAFPPYRLIAHRPEISVTEHKVCAHLRPTAQYDHLSCNDCGAVKAGVVGWNLARHKWFKNYADAKHYDKKGRHLE